MSDLEGRATYRFGPRQRRGIIGGWRPVQLVVAAASVLAALLALRSLRAPLGPGVAVLSLLGAVAAVAVPIAGRTADEWAPLVLAFALRRTARERPLPAGGSPHGARPPGPFRPLAVVSLEAPDGALIGALHDARRGSWTGVLALAADGFGLLPAGERARRVGSWASVLAAVAQQPGAISHLAWIERTVPDDLRALRRHAGATTGGPATGSYRQLLEGEGVGLLRHELLLACTVGGGRRRAPAPAPAPADGALGRAVEGSRWRGRRPLGNAEAGVLLAGELGRLMARCTTAGIALDGVLGPAELAEVVRTSFSGAAPPAAPAEATVAEAPRSSPPASVTWPWPLAVSEEWGVLRTDGSWHATYWVSEWPRSDVGGDFLLPLLVGSWARRSVALVMTPLPPLRAMRAAEHASTEQVADAELRMRHGFAVTARHRLARDAVERREHELAAGHAAYRYSGYVTVSASERAELAQSCLAVEQAAALSHLELRRLYGAQGEAFACTLPSGAGAS